MQYAVFILTQEKNAIVEDITNVALTLENETISESLKIALKLELQNYEQQLNDIESAIINLSL